MAKKLDFKSTKELPVPKNIIGQVIGQEEAVEVIKKASLQRRHVLLIGEPGTGKSMLGLALAELLPKEKLVDILAFPNPNDENAPLIRTVPAGQGRDLMTKARIQSTAMLKNQNVLFIIIAIVISIVPYYLYSKKIFPFDSPVVYAASMITGIAFILGIMLFLNLGKKMNLKVQVPKVVVDNYHKKQSPFLDATGAHAGALLGDVLHDPFQSFFSLLKINKVKDGKIQSAQLKDELDPLFNTYKDKIIINEQNNYEALHLPKDELVVLGEMNGSVSPVDVLSSNRYDYNGKMIKLTTSENKELIITPEHKIAIWKNGRIAYLEARDIKEEDEIVAQAEEIIIDEQDIIATYDDRQREQCTLYYWYLDMKAKNPAWGYKRIAKAMGQPIGKTRWWHAKKHTPIPIQAAQWLKEHGLLPLTINNPKLPLIARVLGATFGDGGIFENLNGIFLSSSEKDAVEEFGHDLERIFSLDHNTNSRIIEGGEKGHSWCYQNTNRNIIRFFLALGAPRGNKTKIELHVPNWIKLLDGFESEFYGSFFGGELGTPIIHKHGNRLTCLEVGITGTPQLRNNRLDFLNEVNKYLKKNRVAVTSIYERKYREEDGALIFRLLIAKKFDNILLFLMNVKIRYCTYKINRLYEALGSWAQLKKNKYYELIDKGYGAEHVMKILNLTPNSLYLLLNHFGNQTPEEATA